MSAHHRLQLVVNNDPLPAWVPDRAPLSEPAQMARLPLVVAWLGVLAGSYFMVAGIAWTAYAVCRVTGACK